MPSTVHAAGDGHDTPTYPDTGKEEQATPRSPEVAAEGQVNLRHFAGFSLACLARIALARAFIFIASVLRPVLRNRTA